MLGQFWKDTLGEMSYTNLRTLIGYKYSRDLKHPIKTCHISAGVDMLLSNLFKASATSFNPPGGRNITKYKQV